jgi:REP element-mobilizing transposase RayT
LSGWFKETDPTPLYHPKPDGGAYHLRYSWTGFASGGSFAQRPIAAIEDTRSAWERDGLRVLEYRWTDELVQILFSATPGISPERLAARAKGRLDHALRQAKIDLPFSRKVSVRAVGDNTRRDLEEYLKRQVDEEQFADERCAASIGRLQFVDPRVNLSIQAESARGQYWYNLHLVLVARDRGRIRDPQVLQRLRDAFLRIAAKNKHTVGRLAVMPDHLHAMVRPQIGESPLEIVFGYQNNLAYMLDQGRIWSDGYYVGTVGEYSMAAVRKNTVVPRRRTP